MRIAGFTGLCILSLFTPLRAQDPVEIIRSDEQGMLFALKPFELIIREKYIDGIRHQQIEYESLTQQPGDPQLPLISFLIGIPPDATPTLSIVETDHEDIPDVLLCPAPEWALAEDGALREVYRSIDPAKVSSSFYPAQPAVIGEIGQFRGQRVARIEVYPLQYHPGMRTLRTFSTLKAEIRFNGAGTSVRFHDPHAESLYANVLVNPITAKRWRAIPRPGALRRTAPWYQPGQTYFKLLVSREGIHHLTYARLQQAGIPVDRIDPRTLQLFCRGEEIPLYAAGEADAVFDPDDFIEFYGESNDDDEYSDVNIYWLSFGVENGARIAEKASLSGEFDAFLIFRKQLHIERDLSFYHGDESATLIDTDLVPGEGWIWKVFYQNEIAILDLTLPQVAMESSGPCTLNVRLRGTTLDPVKPDHHAIFRLNGETIGEVRFDDREQIVGQFIFENKVLNEGNNRLEIESGNTGAKINAFYLDWIDISYLASTRYAGDALTFTAEEDGSGRFSLWDASSDTLSIHNVTQGYRLADYEVRAGGRTMFRVVSRGFDDGNLALIYIDDQELAGGGHRGHNIAVYDSSSGAVVDTKWYDTHASAGQSDSMAAYIARIPEGRYVLAAIADEGATQMTEAGYRALESLGSALCRQVKFRDSWALIGRKGAATGSVAEKLVPQYGGMASVEHTIFTHGPDQRHIVFADAWRAGDRYVIATPDSMRVPDVILRDEYRNLRDAGNGADYIFITHENFSACATKFAGFWSERGLRTKIVDIQDVYDEFNDGIKHARAIKDFLSHAYHHWAGPPPAYVLLIGDASWDPKLNSPSSVKTDFIPIWGNPVTDHWFVCFDGEGDMLADMFIGRLPIETHDEGEQIFAKVQPYASQPSAEWVKRLLFINGGFNNNEQAIFGAQSAGIIRDFVTPPPASCVPTVISKELDGLYEGEKREDIAREINAGKLWVNFIGHGGSGTWELMFHDEQVFALENGDHLPFVSSFTCHTGRFANPEITNFGENFLKAPDAGAIGFMGSSGWGFVSEDERFARCLYESVLQDTVHELGRAMTLAKIKLWGTTNPNIRTRSIIYQYALLGDPALNLALPEVPDLVVRPDGLSWTPYSPVEADSALMLKLRIMNYGLATADSVGISIVDDASSAIIHEGRLRPVGFTDSLSVAWDIAGLAGPHTLLLTADPWDAIPEADETNNRASFSLSIGSSRISLSRPGQNQMLGERRPVLQINNPTSPGTERRYLFELDTVPGFGSPALIQSPAIEEGALVTRWVPPELLPEKRYHWRVRMEGEEPQLTASFFIGDGFGWRQDRFEGTEHEGTELTEAGIQLKQRRTIFQLESAGFDDGNVAVIFINSNSVANATRGHNIAICDANGDFIEFRNFDTHDSPADVAAMVDFLNLLADGTYALVAIRDSGVHAMTGAAYQALESLGSRYCRQVEFRDSWAMIGRKGAPVGSVPEKWVKRYEGIAVLTDTLLTYESEGEVNSPVIGPANGWTSLSWSMTGASPVHDLTLQVLGFNRRTAQWESLRTDLRNAEETSLASISPEDYPLLKLRGLMRTSDPFSTPVLNRWSVTYDPVGDLAIGEQSVRVSADTVIEGGSVNIDVSVFNVGYAGADSSKVRFYFQNSSQGKTLFSEQTLPEIPADAEVSIRQSWSSPGKAGSNRLFIEVDADQSVNELNEDNNFLIRTVFVQPDTARPRMRVTFDGKTVVDHAYVSAEPVIDIEVHDNSPLSMQGDSSRIRLLLDDRRLSYADHPDMLVFLPLDVPEDSSLKAHLRFTPKLSDGDHTLHIFVQDAGKNSTAERLNFRVLSQLRILEPLNYPNPFRGSTHFTYFLTQPAEHVTIKVYTVAGRLIRQLDACPATAGYNQVFWDGRDQDDDALANGVYFYKILARTGDEQAEVVEKCVVMR